MTGKTPPRRIAGFSLVEMMVAIVVLSLVSTGVIGYYQSLRRAATTQELSASVEDNLRLGLETLATSLRGASYGVPSSGLSTWVGWVEGFTSNPQLTDGPSGAPDTLTVASCTSQPVARLSADADKGSTTLPVTDIQAPINDRPNDINDDFNPTDRGLIYISDEESARIKSVNNTTQITVDTNPTTPENEGLTRNYKVDTPICRVDVFTYKVDNVKKQLTREENQGNPMPVAANIVDLQIIEDTSGIKPAYNIKLTGQSSRKDPSTGSVVTRSLSTTVSLRN